MKKSIPSKLLNEFDSLKAILSEKGRIIQKMKISSFKSAIKENFLNNLDFFYKLYYNNLVKINSQEGSV